MKLSFTLLFLFALVFPVVVFGGEPIRQKICLNDSSWRFIKQDVPYSEKFAFDDNAWQKVHIPHDWNGGIDGINNDVFKGPDMYLGPGSYRSNFFINKFFKGKQLSIQFEAVSLAADVWLNGKYLGKHKGGYTAFSFDITSAVNYGAKNVLVVKATNTNDPTMAPWMAIPYGYFPNSSDYAVYGGIYRDVWLISTSDVSIASEHHTTSIMNNSSAKVNIKTTVENFRKQDVMLVLNTTVADSSGKAVKSVDKPFMVKANSKVDVEQSIEVEKPQLWSPETPYLYKLSSVVIEKDKEIDAVESNLGFRSYLLKNGTGFVLNGKKAFLHGVNRHQDREGCGYALTNKQHWEDMELIKSLGFNFLRHAHYPADEAVLDACDKLGIMVWLEIPVSTCISPDPAFLENAKSQLIEMINEHSNHPCLIVWGLGNESDRSGASTEAYTNEFFKQLNKLAHAIDSTRPTTGCNFNFESNQNIPDVYAPQDWTGWYVGEYADNYFGYDPKKMIGEYGADSYILSHDEKFISTAKAKPWTQESACRLHEYKVAKGESLSDQYPGHLTWVAFDFASPRKDRAGNPIPYMNEKGLVAYDHKTLKDVAYFYRSHYTDAHKAPMVYIVSHTWTDRIQKPGKYNIWIYSNCDSVVLYNGFKKNSLGGKIKNGGPLPERPTRFEWRDAEINDNILYAEGYVDGKVVASDTLEFTGFSGNK